MSTQTTAYNLGVGLIVAVGSLTYGFGFASVATSIGQPGFYIYFNLSTTGPGAAYTNHILGALNALFFFGAAVGALSIGPLADAIGRKKGLIYSSVLACFGGALAAGSVHIAMLIVFRFLQGCGLGSLATLVPIYLSETSTAKKRGMLTGLHGFFLVSGYNLAAWVGVGCFFAKNLTFGWRAPIALTVLPPLVLLLGTLFVPESPRWLIMKDRPDEAWTILSRLHKSAGGVDDPAARAEFYQMREQIVFENSNPSGYWAILTTRKYLKRAFLACFIQFAAQSSGGLTISSYSVIIYTELGLTGVLPLLMYAIYTLIGALGNLGSLLTIDKTGRRPVLIIGLSGCLVALIIETAMVAEYVEVPKPNPGGQKVAVFAFMLFVFFYGLFLDAASFIYSSEIYPTNVRARGVALATFTYFTFCIAYVTPGATALAAIGWKYFLVFVCVTFFSVLVVAFFYPETKGKSLEDLAELFGDPVIIHLTDETGGEKSALEVVNQVETVTQAQPLSHAGAEPRLSA